MSSLFDSFAQLFSADGFVPRRVCGAWPDWLVWEHVFGNAMIWLAYVAVPLMIWRLGAKNPEWGRFRALARAFAGFIVLCGLGHFLDMLAFFRPLYRLSGHVLLVTGLVSWWTAWSFSRAWPALVAMKSPADLEREVKERTVELTRAVAELGRTETERVYLATLVESSNDAIVGKDLNGIVTAWNTGAQRLFGYTSREAVGRSSSFLLPEGREHEEATILHRLHRGERIEHFESQRRAKGDRLIDVSLTISPIKDSTGRLIGISKIARDITEKKEAEAAIRMLNADLEARVESRTRELETAKEIAEAAARAKGEFLANVSHEIRTPLNAVVGLTNLTLDTSLNSIQKENLEIIRSAADSLLVLIEDLLDFSRIEAGRVRLDPDPFALRDQLGDTLSLLAPRADAKGIEVAMHISPDVPDGLVGDAARLRQILVNLVGNAIKFTSTGVVLLEVALRTRAGNEVELQFRVIDSGIGIPEDKREVIFSPFVQADGSTTRQYGGTGLGLTISSELIQLMGGRIWVDSEVGVGSTFSFTARFALDSETRDHEPHSELALRGLRVLVVDDIEVNLRIADSMLTKWGMEVSLASNATDAISALQNAGKAGTAFTIVILDAQMPDVDGFELAQRIRKLPESSGVLIMMLSSTDRASMVKRCSDLGIGTYLHKPIQEKQLRNAILGALGAATEVERTPETHAPAPAKMRPLRVLLAEDNPHNQRVVDLMLKRDGHSMSIVKNGREAVETWARTPFDIVLMDVQMPEVDGYQATASIRAAELETGRHVPIIALTAFAREEDRNRCILAGMDHYLSKPVDADQLRAAIDHCLAQQEPAATEPERKDGKGVWDADLALALLDGDLPYLLDMAALFLAQAPELLKQIDEAIEVDNVGGILAPAHALKNGFGNFAATRAFELLGELEEICCEGKISDVRMVWEELDREANRFVRSLSQFTIDRGASAVPTRYS
jgi:two-component system sensor histidine kinase/response regulator